MAPPISKTAFVLIAALAGAVPAHAVQLDYVGTHVWSVDHPDFGGFSGLEISDDGSEYIALSDRATIWWGKIRRGSAGAIRGLSVAGSTRLKRSDGTPLQPGYLGDSEGLALGKDGSLWVSFEGLTRVVRFASPDAPSEPLPSPPAFKDFPPNGSLEALAVMDDGTLLTMPERSGANDRPFPVFRYRDGEWDQPFSVPRDDNWLPVGADVGPDGRLYLLKRRFQGIFGFSSRVWRYDIEDDALTNGELLLESTPSQYDNLEGLAVWADGLGIRLTMISDDNFFFLQRTELVEYRVRD